MTVPSRDHVEVDGESIAFSVFDLRAPWAEPAIPIVLLHGLGLQSESWRPWIATLAAERPVVAIDLRGHGGSAAAWRAPTYPLEVFAGDVVAVADRLGVERFHFVGESFGGTIGLRLAIGSPERVASVTVCSTAFDGSRIQHIRHWPELAADPESFATWSAELAEGRLGPNPAPRLRAYLDESHRAVSPHVVAGVVACLLETDLAEELATLEVPVQVISPESSPFVDPSNAIALAEKARHGEVAFVPGAFHGVILSHWRDCVDLVRAFAARVDGAAAATVAPAFAGDLDGSWVSGIGAHVGIEVPDLDEGLRFYRDVLGLVEDWRHELSPALAETVTGAQGVRARVVQLLAPGGSRVELWTHERRDESGASEPVAERGLDHLSFAVSDVRATHARLAAAGVEFTLEPVDVSDPEHPLLGWQAAFFEDPWGTRLEIVGPDPQRGLDTGERGLDR